MRFTERTLYHVGCGLALATALCLPALRAAAEDREDPVFPVVTGEPPEVEGALAWQTLKDVAHLRQEVEAATRAGKIVVVSTSATWCAYGKKYEALIEGDDELRAGFSRAVRLRLDVTEDPRHDLRAALGMGSGQPRMVFLDRRGRILRAADVTGWQGLGTARSLRMRLLLAHAGGPAESEWGSEDVR
jgi:thiol:disulfide interchange protein